MRSSSGHLRRFFITLPAAAFLDRLFRAFVFARFALLLRHRVLQRKLQLLNRRMREDHRVVPQQVVGMHVISPHQFEPVNVARAQFQVAILMLRRFHDQHRRSHFQRIERLAKFLGLWLFHVERIHHDQLPVGKFRRQRRTQGAQQFLTRECVVVRTRYRTMHRRAVPPQWRPNRSNTRAAGPLLLPQLLAGAGNFPARLGLVRSGALPGAVVLHRFPEQVFVDRAEDLIGEIECPYLLAAQIVNINRCHIFSRYSVQGTSVLNYAFFAALFAAFKGSTVAAPANPRRSRGGFFAFVITMYPPCGPGTLPSTTSRFSSLSTPSTRRFRAVTCLLPMWPDMRMPLNTRDGNAEDPIEPVIWNIEPTDSGPPPK